VGIIQAAEEEGIYAIGYSIDQNPIAPETVISTLLYDSAIQYLREAEKERNGEWTGEVRLYGIGSGVTDIADFHGLVPDDIAEQVLEVRKQIETGELEVPYITESSQ
jgi:basic membrane protein A